MDNNYSEILKITKEFLTFKLPVYAKTMHAGSHFV